MKGGIIIKALALMSVVGQKDDQEDRIESPMWYAKRARLAEKKNHKKKSRRK